MMDWKERLWMFCGHGVALSCLVSLPIAGCGDATMMLTSGGDEDLSVAGVTDLAGDGAVIHLPDLAVGPCGTCKPPTPLCDVKTKRCVACLADSDCPDQ